MTEKRMENKFVIPDYFPIKESKRVAVEILDGLLSNLFGIHFLEPMSELKEHVRARPVLKAVAKDRIMSEVVLAPTKAALSKTKATRTNRLNLSSDATPIRPMRPGLPGVKLPRDQSRAEVIKNPLIPNNVKK